jgi:hypothetical protein
MTSVFSSTSTEGSRDVPAHHVLDQLASGRDERQTPRPPGCPSGSTEQADIARPPKGYSALGGEVSSEAGHQAFEDLRAAREQDMQMARLRNALSEGRIVGKRVAIDDDDLREPIRQDAGGQEPGHAAADHDGSIRCRDRGGSHDRSIIHPRRLERSPQLDGDEARVR